MQKCKAILLFGRPFHTNCHNCAVIYIYMTVKVHICCVQWIQRVRWSARNTWWLTESASDEKTYVIHWTELLYSVLKAPGDLPSVDRMGRRMNFFGQSCQSKQEDYNLIHLCSAFIYLGGPTMFKLFVFSNSLTHVIFEAEISNRMSNTVANADDFLYVILSQYSFQILLYCQCENILIDFTFKIFNSFTRITCQCRLNLYVVLML